MPAAPAGPSPDGAARCAVHPGRIAVDACPVCGRPRCAADARAGAAGCAGCRGGGSPVTAEPSRARLVAAVDAGLLVALAAGAISSDYVGAAGFDLAAPLLGGVATGLVVTVVARTRGRGRWDWPLRVVAALLGLLGVALSFRLVPGRLSPLQPLGSVLPAYAAAVVGALGSRLLR